MIRKTKLDEMEDEKERRRIREEKLKAESRFDADVEFNKVDKFHRDVLFEGYKAYSKVVIDNAQILEGKQEVLKMLK